MSPESGAILKQNHQIFMVMDGHFASENELLKP